MLRSTRFGLAVMLVLGAACQPAPKTETESMGGEPTAATAGLSAEDEAAVRAVDSAWSRAASAGDGKAIEALYASNATLLPPMESVVEGEAAKKYWVDFTNAFSGPAELTTTDVEGRGDLAYAVGKYRMTLTPKKAGAKPLPTEEGKYLTVLKKQADGSWKIVYDIWSPNAPPGKK
jgi:ketosteroid isomerase-like protein